MKRDEKVVRRGEPGSESAPVGDRRALEGICQDGLEEERVDASQIDLVLGKEIFPVLGREGSADGVPLAMALAASLEAETWRNAALEVEAICQSFPGEVRNRVEGILVVCDSWFRSYP